MLLGFFRNRGIEQPQADGVVFQRQVNRAVESAAVALDHQGQCPVVRWGVELEPRVLVVLDGQAEAGRRLNLDSIGVVGAAAAQQILDHQAVHTIRRKLVTQRPFRRIVDLCLGKLLVGGVKQSHVKQAGRAEASRHAAERQRLIFHRGKGVIVAIAFGMKVSVHGSRNGYRCRYLGRIVGFNFGCFRQRTGHERGQTRRIASGKPCGHGNSSAGYLVRDAKYDRCCTFTGRTGKVKLGRRAESTAKRIGNRDERKVTDP